MDCRICAPAPVEALENALSELDGIMDSGDWRMADDTYRQLDGVREDIRAALRQSLRENK